MPFNDSLIASELSITPKQKRKWHNIAKSAFENYKENGVDNSAAFEKAVKVANASIKIRSRESGEGLFNSKVLFDKFALEAKSATIEGNYVKNVRIIKPGLANGMKGRKFYSKESLATLVPFLKEMRGMFVNHRIEKLGRDLGDLIATIEDAWQGDDGAVYADILFLGNPKYQFLADALKRDLTVCELSIFAFIEGHYGKIDGVEEDIIYVDRFVGGHSVDFVYKGGAGGGFVYENKNFDGVEFMSDEFLTVMESASPMSEINFDQVAESFAKYTKNRAIDSIFYWFADYIMYQCIYCFNSDGSDLDMEQKLELISAGFDEFKITFIELLKDSKYWEKYKEEESEEDLEKSMETLEKSIMENKDFVKMIGKIKQVIETKHKEMIVADNKSLVEKNPDYTVIEASGFARGVESFTQEREIFNAEKEKYQAALENIKILEDKNKNLTEDIQKLTEKVNAFEVKQAEERKSVEIAARKEFIEKTLTDSGVSRDIIPATIMTKMESIEAFSDEDVFSTIKSFVKETPNEHTDTPVAEGVDFTKIMSSFNPIKK